jgi:DNA-binding MarR family transcriptional regulator
MAKEFELYDAPGHLIRRLQQIAVALFFAGTRRFDITPVQYAALFSIREKPGLDQTALAHVIAFDRSTIANVVERLESKKLITRKAGASDRRTKRLYITPAGQKLLAGAIPAVQSVQEMILAPLDPGERDAFMAMLQRMVDLNNSHSRAPLRMSGAAPVRKLP